MADHPVFAALYDRMCAASERAGLEDRRRHLLSQATGDVLEIGAGTGANLAHYPARSVHRVVALEPDGAMRRRLAARVASGAVPIEVVDAAAETAPFPDDSFDTVVSTLVLCTVDDPAAALRRIRGLLRPGGRLLFLEHVADVGPRRSAQRVAGPLWTRLMGGCRPDRDTVRAIRDAGFVVADCDRFALPAVGPIIRAAVQGVALAKAAA